MNETGGEGLDPELMPWDEIDIPAEVFRDDYVREGLNYVHNAMEIYLTLTNTANPDRQAVVNAGNLNDIFVYESLSDPSFRDYVAVNTEGREEISGRIVRVYSADRHFILKLDVSPDPNTPVICALNLANLLFEGHIRELRRD